MQDFRRDRQSASRLTAHLVCVTKYRRTVFDAAALAWLQDHFAKVCETMGCVLLGCHGEADHLHAIIEYPPKVAVSGLVNALRGTSSRLLRRERPRHRPTLVGGRAAPLDVVRRYVDQQRASGYPAPP